MEALWKRRAELADLLRRLGSMLERGALHAVPNSTHPACTKSRLTSAYRSSVLSTKDFERDLAELTPANFEQLVFQVVLKEHPSAQSVKAPDFGADVLDDPASKRPRVWQVKHYPGPGEIKWTVCKNSLDRAVEKWSPIEVTFVFPRDLTGKEQQGFQTHLAERQSIPVRPWSASNLNQALERYPAIRRSFFPNRTGELHQVLQAARLTEQPAGGPAFLEHGVDLAELADELDPHFHYELRSGAESLPQATWDRPPFMSVTMIRDGRQSSLAAFPKTEGHVAASWSFTNDEAGAHARERTYRAIARGEKVELFEGIATTADPAPTAIKQIMDEMDPEAEGRNVLILDPVPDTLALTVAIEDASALERPLRFEMRSAPPKPGHDAAWVGLADGAILYMGFQRKSEDEVTVEFSLTMDLGPSAAGNAMATATVLSLLTKPLHVEGNLVPAEGATLDLRPVTDDELLERLQFLADVYGAMIEIEARTDTRFRIPDFLPRDDALAALNLQVLLRDRKTSGRSHLKTTLHVPPHQAPALAARLAEGRQVAVPFEQDLLGQAIRFGWARITFERLAVTVAPPAPDGKVGLRVEADGEVKVRLIDEPLPSDVALDLATDTWNSATVS
jgi:hypothetical protein